MSATFEFCASAWQNFLMRSPSCVSRRNFLLTTGAALLATKLPAQEPEPIIDIHQHTDYAGRSFDDIEEHLERGWTANPPAQGGEWTDMRDYAHLSEVKIR